MKLGELAASVNWEFGLVVGDLNLEQEAVNAARQFHGWGSIRSLVDAATTAITKDTEISDGEWSVIKPLYMLYIERENARALEASRGQGVDVYGRTISEIEPDIRDYENNVLPRAAFSWQPESI